MITELILVAETKEEQLSRETRELRESLDKCRKKQFAEIGTLKKQVLEIKNEFDDWKALICKGNL